MSYILDALRRAEAERSRGRSTPAGLNAPLPWSPVTTHHARPSFRWTGVAWAVMIGAGLSGLAVWSWMRPAERLAPSASEAVTRPIAAAPGPAIQPSTAPTAAIATPAVQTAAASMTEHALEPPRPAARTAAPKPPDAVAVASPTVPPAATRPAPNPAQRDRHPPMADRTVAEPVRKANADAPPHDTRAVLPTFNELPESIRRELPRMTLGGSVYSEDRASRFLILNGEVVHEGAQIAPHLVLETISPRAAIFRYRDTRWRLPV